MTEFHVVLHDEDACIIPLSHLSLRELTHELKDVLAGVPDGEPMLFDTLFHAGNGADRFIQARIKDEAINWDTAEVIAVPTGGTLRREIAAAIKPYSDAIDASILSSVQKKMLHAGLGI